MQVWISPIVHNIAGVATYGDAYMGFWADDIYAVNQHFGTAADLRALSDALHARGMVWNIFIVKKGC
jgi:alpha-amylase